MSPILQVRKLSPREVKGLSKDTQQARVQSSDVKSSHRCSP